MSDSDDALSTGSFFGNYEIIKVLGQGAFGVVYEALRQPLGKRAALKVLHRKLVSQQEVLQRFLREAQTTARIQHPHIVETFDIGEHAGAPYLAMEFLEGEPLNTRLKREKALPSTVAVDMMLAVLSAMVTVHERGIIHRDLKPENIFLVKHRSGMHPKVLDFGIAKVSAQDSEMALTRTTALLGTPYYMSPEQAKESKHIDARSDQWALGVILYECVTGRRPFSGGSLLELLNAIATAEYVAPTRVKPELPEGVEAVIARALRVIPAERFPDVRAMGAELLPYASDAGRALWTEEFTAPRTTTAPPPPDEDVAETTEFKEDLHEMLSARSNSGSRPNFGSSSPSSSSARGARPVDIAATAAMTAPPLAAVGGTLTLASRESATPTTTVPTAKRWVVPAAGAALVVVLGGVWMATRTATSPVTANLSAARPASAVLTHAPPAPTPPAQLPEAAVPPPAPTLAPPTVAVVAAPVAPPAERVGPVADALRDPTRGGRHGRDRGDAGVATAGRGARGGRDAHGGHEGQSSEGNAAEMGSNGVAIR